MTLKNKSCIHEAKLNLVISTNSPIGEGGGRVGGGWVGGGGCLVIPSIQLHQIATAQKHPMRNESALHNSSTAKVINAHIQENPLPDDFTDR